jgi:hypothetical protein
MAWVFGGKKFGQYTYEHWFDDDEFAELKTQATAQKETEEVSKTEKPNDNTIPRKLPPRP